MNEHRQAINYYKSYHFSSEQKEKRDSKEIHGDEWNRREHFIGFCHLYVSAFH